jgi:hypothetical protein
LVITLAVTATVLPTLDRKKWPELASVPNAETTGVTCMGRVV